jgi:hypothetical protein
LWHQLPLPHTPKFTGPILSDAAPGRLWCVTKARVRARQGCAVFLTLPFTNWMFFDKLPRLNEL